MEVNYNRTKKIRIFDIYIISFLYKYEYLYLKFLVKSKSRAGQAQSHGPSPCHERIIFGNQVNMK